MLLKPLSVVLVLANSALGFDYSWSGTASHESVTVTEQYASYLEKSERYIPVSQLSALKTNHWSFQALKSLIERYGVVTDNLDNIHQRITRDEFAVLLNAVSDRINQLIAQGKIDSIRQEDLATLQRLRSQFSKELATLQTRIGNLEEQTNQLAQQQFSPTAKLTGEVIFAVSGAYGSKKADDDEEIDENLIVSDRAWLNFEIDFSERDRLFVRLEAENTPGFDDATGTEMARLGFEGDSDNKFDINQIEYDLSLSEEANLSITTDSSDIQRVANTTSSFSSSGRGAISRFGRYSPFYRQDFGAAVRLKYEFGDVASISLGLGDDNAEDLDEESESEPQEETDGGVIEFNLEPNDNIELFLAYLFSDKDYGVIAQLILEPIDDVELGLTYQRSYNNLDTGTGSELANNPFDDESNNITTNSYGVEANIKVSSGFTLGGWVGLTDARATDLSGNPDATIFNYAVTLAFPDLGKQGSLAGVVIGQPPKVTSNDWGTEYTDKDTSLHLEFFYRFQATDNIAITPGLLIITNPEHNANNDAIYIGTLRTTFTF
jgi:GGDEF domain-containing protein